jgi:hypothetical protein
MSVFRRGFVDSRDRPGIAGTYRARRRAAQDRVSAGQGLFSLLVAGDGFEPS